MADLITYDPANPPLAKLHIVAQLDRDLARYKTGRTRVAWKAFPIKDVKTKEEIARIEFTSDGGIAFTFKIATAEERSWSISAQSLFDCIDTADKLYVNATTPAGKQALRDALKKKLLTKNKRKARRVVRKLVRR